MLDEWLYGQGHVRVRVPARDDISLHYGTLSENRTNRIEQNRA